MSASAPSQRFRLWGLLALMLLLALGAIWLNQVLQRATDDYIPRAARTEPDFWVENFSYVKTSKDGQARYHISGQRLTHNPRDDSYDVQRPVVNSLVSGRAPTTMRAVRAKVDSDNSKVHLYDDVHVDRPGTAGSDPLHLSTDYLLVLPDDDVMQTDKAVDITIGTSHLSGIGMYANNATREFRLSNRVHGTYQSTAH
ncbi:LPS export ABC transporter periplasmic protein LptC [Noviherbaspirillum massiliense]|uniref:LPS export ABC transporter periplasmic protein LptC n=1 Tax=Noviherbaspirillum massiliense TaxID=1465823 RepID=UPI00030755FE|nr:LPS export ABC transporter periplasmic protein LptC [Noviherbaspirillum massiliense]